MQQQNNFKEVVTCKLCKKYFEDPILLPCGGSVCSEHIDINTSQNDYECDHCSQKHTVPKDGFPSNLYIMPLFNLYWHLDKTSKEEHALIKQLDLSIEELIHLNEDPDNYVFQYISEIINEIDCERERLIAEINKISDEMINKLRSFREECKENIENLDDLINENRRFVEELEEKSKLCKEKLRIPELDQKLVNEMIEDTKKWLNETNEKNYLLKIKALNGKEWSFCSKNFLVDREIFGELKFEQINFEFEQNKENEGELKFVINEVSKLRERNGDIYSPSCIIANLPWKIYAKINKSNLGLHVYCDMNSRSKTWSAEVDYKIKLKHLSNKKQENLVGEFTDRFNSENKCSGWENFTTINQLFSSKECFYDSKNDCISIEVSLKVLEKNN